MMRFCFQKIGVAIDNLRPEVDSVFDRSESAVQDCSGKEAEAIEQALDKVTHITQTHFTLQTLHTLHLVLWQKSLSTAIHRLQSCSLFRFRYIFFHICLQSRFNLAGVS